MDGVQGLLEALKEGNPINGHFRGLLHVLIGRRIEDPKGAVISAGLTWRATAAALRKARWTKEAVRELGLDPDSMPPRDRERFWYAAIVHAQVGSPEATRDGDRVAKILHAAGYRVGPPPGG